MDDADEGRQPALPARAGSFETAAAPLPQDDPSIRRGAAPQDDPSICRDAATQDERIEGRPHLAPAAQERSSPGAGPSIRRGAATQDERGEVGAEFAVSPNKNRLVQVRRTGKRKLFDRKRRKTFLNWFAATCNARLSAAKAGVAYQTVFKHRMKDEGFAAAWDRALAQGYARIEARSVEEVERLGTCSPVAAHSARPSRPARTPHPAHTPHPAQPGAESPSPGTGEGEEGIFDVQLALQLLREHARRLSAGSGPGAGAARDQRTTARAAGNKEIAAALVKRLRAFALRQGSGQAARIAVHAPHPAHSRVKPGTESPSPLKGER